MTNSAFWPDITFLFRCYNCKSVLEIPATTLDDKAGKLVLLVVPCETCLDVARKEDHYDV